MFRYIFRLKTLIVAVVLSLAMGQVKAQSAKPEPFIQVTPSIINMAIGATKEVTVELSGDYMGGVSAVVNDQDIAYVSEKIHNIENHRYIFTVISFPSLTTEVSSGISSSSWLTASSAFSLELYSRYFPTEIRVRIMAAES